MENAVAIAREICSLPISLDNCWKITSAYPSMEDPQLILIHTNDHYDPEKVSHAPLQKIRGIIIDTKRKAIVVNSPGHEIVMTTHSPLKIAENGDLEFETVLKTSGTGDSYAYTVGTKRFKSGKYTIRLGYEGAILRIFKWEEKVFVATYKNLDGKTASIPGRPPFFQIFEDMTKGWLDLNSLYDHPSKSCIVAYNFLICHDCLKTVSSISDQFVIPTPYSVASEEGRDDCTCREHKFLPLGEETINVEIANKFLFPNKFADKDYGESLVPGEIKIIRDVNTYPAKITNIKFKPTEQIDERLHGGDFVMLYDEEEKTFYKIESPGYTFRRGVLFGSINFYNQFIKTISFFASSDANYIYKNNNFPYPLLSAMDKKGKGKKREMKPLPLATRRDKYIYVQTLYKLIMAPSIRKWVGVWMESYHRDINALASFFAKVEPTEEFRKENTVFTAKTYDVWMDLRGGHSNYHHKAPRIPNKEHIKELLYESRRISIGPLLSQFRSYLKKQSKETSTTNS